jgi:tetratricopeptide (TPR) repeat protein
MCQYALAKAPADARIFNQLGCIKLKEGSLAESLTLLNRAVRLEPADPVILNNLGAVLRRAGRLQQAVAILQRAISIAPDYAKAHFNLGKSYRALCEERKAQACQLQATDLDPDFFSAYAELAVLNMPGEDYLSILGRIHGLLQSPNYVEIGVDTGRSMALAGTNTQVIGIDPTPRLWRQLPDNAKTYEMTSDDFFQNHDLRAELDGSAVQMAFIDGLHTFEQVLRDWMHLECFAAENAVFLLHDVIPLDEKTSTPQRKTAFWSGDTWKIIPCLLDTRPDLDIFVVPTPPTGLAVIRHLNPAATGLRDNFADLLADYAGLTFADFTRLQTDYEIVDNVWDSIQARLSR